MKRPGAGPLEHLVTAAESVPVDISEMLDAGLVEGARGRFSDVAQLLKARVAILVLLTAAVGFVLASRYLGAGVDVVLFCTTLLGTAALAAGAAACNQVLERDRDALMARTRGRPLPSGRISTTTATVLGGALAIAGLIVLSLRVNPVVAVLGAITFLSYVFLYTPLKTRTHLATVIGAVPGALPPLMGWAAVSGRLDPPAWSLFGILFFWQLPHFLAIAWLYRHDYARGGFAMLTVLDPSGESTSRQVLVNSVVLLPVSLLPCAVRLSGPLYFWSALPLGLVFCGLACWMAATRSRRSARVLLSGSILYLAFLLVALLADRGVAWPPV